MGQSMSRWMFKKMRLVIVFDMFLNPSFKMTTSSSNIARTTASQVKLYTRIYIFHTFSWDFTNLSDLVNILLTNQNFI